MKVVIPMLMRQGQMIKAVSGRGAGAAFAIALILSACAPNVKIGAFAFYTPPAATTAREPIEITANTGRQALDIVAKTLRADGARITAKSTRHLTIEGKDTRNDRVACGTITQSAPEGRSTFAANAERAVLFDAGAPGGIKFRLVDVETRFRLTMSRPVNGVSTGALAQTHRVTIRTTTADQRKLLSSQTLTFAPGARATFDDGTVCVSSGQLRKVLAR